MSRTSTRRSEETVQLRGREGLDHFRHLSAAGLEFTPPEGLPPRAGAEIEFHTRPVGEPGGRVDPARLSRILRKLSDSISTSIEPGGQVELNGPPDHDMARLVARARRDLSTVRALLSDHGIEMDGGGLDWRRPPRRLLDSSRYRNMEAVFDRSGPSGRLMMCNTASLQITVDPAGDATEAWLMAHRIGPCLLAAAASSPRSHPGFPTEAPWRSERHRIWESVEPSRVGDVSRSGRPMAEAWARFALDAQVLQVGSTDGAGPVPAPPGLTLGAWISEGLEGSGPTVAETRHHVTTLFPWVRPRGPLELRVMDVPTSMDPAPLLTLAGVLMTRPRLWPAAREATAATAGRWRTAARCGARHRMFETALGDLVALVTDELTRTGDFELTDTLHRWWTSLTPHEVVPRRQPSLVEGSGTGRVGGS